MVNKALANFRTRIVVETYFSVLMISLRSSQVPTIQQGKGTELSLEKRGIVMKWQSQTFLQLLFTLALTQVSVVILTNNGE